MTIDSGPAPYEPVWNALERRFSTRRAMEVLERIHASDRPGTTPACARTAALVAGTMRRIGMADVETIPYRADGRSRLLDWLPSPAWTATRAHLSVESPGRLRGTLARYPAVPTCLAVNSAATPETGVRGELVIEGRSGPGKFVLTSRLPSEVRQRCGGTGVAGIVSDSAPAAAIRIARPDTAVTWDPSWHQPWPVPAVPCFMISPRDGRRLRDALAKGERVRLFARADARNYAGEIATVTGVIPGRDRSREIVAAAHLCEIGANDNASGAAVLLEAARCLAALPRGESSVRILLPFECYGTLAWLLRPRTAALVAGINLDMVGEDQRACGSTLEVAQPPESAPGFAPAIIHALLDDLSRRGGLLRWREARFVVDDNAFLSDPLVGCPAPLLLNQPDRFYHSDLDTPDKVDPRSLREVGIVAGTYLGWLARARLRDAVWIARRVARWSERRLSAETRAWRFELDGARSAPARRRVRRAAAAAVAFWEDRARARLDSVGRLGSGRLLAGEIADLKSSLARAARRRRRALGAPASPLSRPPGPIPVRTRPGIPALDGFAGLKRRIAAATGESYPWSAFLVSALFWADGKRTTGEIAECLRQEFGRGDPAAIRRLFEVLSEGGHVALRK